jgi:hypothetical protein
MMDGDDLVKRLRDKHCCDATKCNCDEAADRIEQLEAALQKWLQYNDKEDDGGIQMMLDYNDALEATRAALGEKTND